MRVVVGLLLAIGVVALSGCVARTATPAVQGKAYVVKGSYFGTSTYNCDATGGRPKCWEVIEKELEE